MQNEHAPIPDIAAQIPALLEQLRKECYETGRADGIAQTKKDAALQRVNDLGQLQEALEENERLKKDCRTCRHVETDAREREFVLRCSMDCTNHDQWQAVEFKQLTKEKKT